MRFKIGSPAIRLGGAAANCAEALLQKAPVDCARKLCERMVHVHDLIEPRLEKIVLSAIPPFPRPHRNPPHRQAKRITAKSADQFARKPIRKAHKPANPFPRRALEVKSSIACQNFTGD
jgi:hypothetical protein